MDSSAATDKDRVEAGPSGDGPSSSSGASCRENQSDLWNQYAAARAMSKEEFDRMVARSQKLASLPTSHIPDFEFRKPITYLPCYDCGELGVLTTSESVASGIPILRQCSRPDCLKPIHELCSTCVTGDRYNTTPFYCTKHDWKTQCKQVVSDQVVVGRPVQSRDESAPGNTRETQPAVEDLNVIGRPVQLQNLSENARTPGDIEDTQGEVEKIQQVEQTPEVPRDLPASSTKNNTADLTPVEMTPTKVNESQDVVGKEVQPQDLPTSVSTPDDMGEPLSTMEKNQEVDGPAVEPQEEISCTAVNLAQKPIANLVDEPMELEVAEAQDVPHDAFDETLAEISGTPTEADKSQDVVERPVQLQNGIFNAETLARTTDTPTEEENIQDVKARPDMARDDTATAETVGKMTETATEEENVHEVEETPEGPRDLPALSTEHNSAEPTALTPVKMTSTDEDKSQNIVGREVQPQDLPASGATPDDMGEPLSTMEMNQNVDGPAVKPQEDIEETPEGPHDLSPTSTANNIAETTTASTPVKMTPIDTDQCQDVVGKPAQPQNNITTKETLARKTETPTEEENIHDVQARPGMLQTATATAGSPAKKSIEDSPVVQKPHDSAGESQSAMESAAGNGLPEFNSCFGPLTSSTAPREPLQKRKAAPDSLGERAVKRVRSEDEPVEMETREASEAGDEDNIEIDMEQSMRQRVANLRDQSIDENLDKLENEPSEEKDEEEEEEEGENPKNAEKAAPKPRKAPRKGPVGNKRNRNKNNGDERVTQYRDASKKMRQITFVECAECKEEGVMERQAVVVGGYPLALKCFQCSKIVHEHCAMYPLQTPTRRILRPPFYCMAHTDKGAIPRASELPTTECTRFVEEQVNCMAEKLGISKIVFRQLNDTSKELKLPEYWSLSLPRNLPYRSKTFYAFLEIGGKDLAFFGFIMSEFADVEHPGNKRMVCLDYLDSLRVLIPYDRKTKRSLFHTILLAYFDFARNAGFTRAFISAIPPASRSSEYLFFNRPANQKTIDDNRLLGFYTELVSLGIERGVLSNFTKGNEWSATTLRDLPIFESGQFRDALSTIYGRRTKKIKSDKKIMEKLGAYFVPNSFHITLKTIHPPPLSLMFGGEEFGRFFEERKNWYRLSKQRNWKNSTLLQAQYATFRMVQMFLSEQSEGTNGPSTNEPSTSSQSCSASLADQCSSV